MSSAIKVDSVTFGYKPQTPVIRDLCFELAPGTFLSVAGPNGAGKSTLLNLLCGALRPQWGTITLDGTPVKKYDLVTRARKIAVVRQERSAALGFRVAETVMMARTPYFGAFGFERSADKEIVAEAMEATDTAQFADRPLASLSGGERQRVFIARALAQQSSILLLDEPTSFLDLKHQLAIYDLLASLQEDRNITVIAVTHDINLACQYSNRTLLLSAVESSISTGDEQHRFYRIGPTAEVLTADSVKSVFGVDVLSCSAAGKTFFVTASRIPRRLDSD